METKKLDLYLAEKLYIGDKEAIRAYNNEQIIYGTEPVPPPPDYSKYYFTIQFDQSGYQSQLQYRWYVYQSTGLTNLAGNMIGEIYQKSAEEYHYGYRFPEDTIIGSSGSDISINTNINMNEPKLCMRIKSTNVQFGENIYIQGIRLDSRVDIYGGIYVYGNILSLIYGDDFRRYTTCDDSYKTRFKGMLSPNYVYNLTNLIVPNGWNKEGIIYGNGDL